MAPGGHPVNAGRLPHHVLAYIFQYLSLKDLHACMMVCKHWSAYLFYENCEVWRQFCHRKLPELAMADPYLLAEVKTYKSKLRAFYHAWNPTDCSRFVVYGCGWTLKQVRFRFPPFKENDFWVACQSPYLPGENFRFWKKGLWGPQRWFFFAPLQLTYFDRCSFSANCIQRWYPSQCHSVSLDRGY